MVCVRERDRETERQTERDREREMAIEKEKVRGRILGVYDAPRALPLDSSWFLKCMGESRQK